jgi:hypothetical protein
MSRVPLDHPRALFIGTSYFKGPLSLSPNPIPTPFKNGTLVLKFLPRKYIKIERYEASYAILERRTDPDVPAKIL